LLETTLETGRVMIIYTTTKVFDKYIVIIHYTARILSKIKPWMLAVDINI